MTDNNPDYAARAARILAGFEQSVKTAHINADKLTLVDQTGGIWTIHNHEGRQYTYNDGHDDQDRHVKHYDKPETFSQALATRLHTDEQQTRNLIRLLEDRHNQNQAN